MIEIELANKKGTAIIDDCDSDLLAFRWRKMSTGYACRGQRESKTRVVTYLMHRMVLERIVGRELATMEYCDHINGNRLDNRRSNLRLATQKQNQQNRRRKRNTDNPYKGIYFDKQRNKWRADIFVNGSHITLGQFSTPELAHKAYCEAAKQHFGEFAKFD